MNIPVFYMFGYPDTILRISLFSDMLYLFNHDPSDRVFIQAWKASIRSLQSSAPSFLTLKHKCRYTKQLLSLAKILPQSEQTIYGKHKKKNTEGKIMTRDGIFAATQ